MNKKMNKKRGHEQKHIADTRKKHSYSRLIIILVLLIIATIIMFPSFTEQDIKEQEIKVEASKPAPIVKPSPEPEEIPVKEVFDESKEEKAVITKPSEKLSEEQIIIKRDSLEPAAITIEEGTVISWINKDTRQHKIVCYINGKRIFLGESLDSKGDISEYKFRDSGEYLCIDAIFGSRMNVIVKPMPLSKITGGTVRELPTADIVLTGLLIFVVLLAISIYLYVNKKI